MWHINLFETTKKGITENKFKAWRNRVRYFYPIYSIQYGISLPLCLGRLLANVIKKYLLSKPREKALLG